MSAVTILPNLQQPATALGVATTVAGLGPSRTGCCGSGSGAIGDRGCP
jgi:hypothetical protein